MNKLSLYVVFLCMFTPATFAGVCDVSLLEETKLFSMTYNDFDQTKNGWRKYADLGCYHQTGLIIDKYIDKNKSILADWQVIAITWHSGQMYAFNNEYVIAKKRFENSINPNESNDSPILWNDYVYATLAFLDNDLSKLKLYRDKIANGPEFNGKKTNLDVIDNLIKYFGEPYSKAYRQ